MSAVDRATELKWIHVRAAKLGMDTRDKNPQSEYRAMLYTVGGASARRGEAISAAHLDHRGRSLVLEHLDRLLRARHAAAETSRPARRCGVREPVTFRPECQALGGKIAAIIARDRLSWNYAASILRRMGGPEKWEWATSEQLHKLVAALEVNARRQAAKQSPAAS